MVSVALATFNGEKFITMQLESIAAQTKIPDELVVCDDNSTDQTVSLINQFAAKVDFPVNIIRNSMNQGFVATFNRALEECKGDLVFLCDQDDFWFPEKIAKTFLFASQNSERKLFMNNAELSDSVLYGSGFTTFGQMESVSKNPYDLVLGCCMVVRRELLDLCLPIPKDFPAHDVWIHEYADYLGWKLLIPDVLQYYRRHQKNETAHIVYSLKKINRLDYKLDFYKRLFSSGKTYSLSQRILNNTLRLNSLEVVIEKNSSEICQKLQVARERLQRELESLTIRHKISQMGLGKRWSYSLKLFASGGYNSGLKSLLRDLLGFS
jgi:glycosyltransferase involved in cell wall biosynthesis